ncbi:anhydro-N-acetylmuramic acid kinase [Algibacter miyuki]|uniref:Anhydro-N-acetylmuramic acid kinase n=1 Tax=Algibacter miyuki TaxID=1306933 RepID=A0ABV5H1A9_9FLAO|nr:anhydro-N-acetylmuramic acid kinase [Algibacter miyuki]MDN3666291.1 anhydro-N-acetylmuramic acid kinase [Algibacter miyuki]
MKKNNYHVIGVMSGTSLDGIDLVEAIFTYTDTWRFEIIKAETVSYTAGWFDTLKNLVSNSLEELQVIDDDYSVFLAETIKKFISKNNITDIDAVCSHGHTALHRPEEKLTYQIGNKPILAEILKETVVCDFRVEDVELGGQGAPLVPIGDKLLFSEYDFCLNLGGFANISTEIEGERIAYDICPVNIVLNKYANQLGFNYDDGGKIAASGNYLSGLGEQLNLLNFYTETPPKSLGLEWVNTNIFPLIESFKTEEKTVLRTFSDHIAKQMALVLKPEAKVLVTGGGAYNTYIIDEIKKHVNAEIIIPNADLVEFKEALIFAFLGILKLRDEVNCLQTVTGASKNHSSGKIY